MNAEPLLSCADFKLGNDCKLIDFSVTDNKIFALTKEGIVDHKIVEFSVKNGTESEKSIQVKKLVGPAF